jgi:hypothetical protein
VTFVKKIKGMFSENGVGCYLKLSSLRHLLFVLFLINCHSVAYNQVIRGTVLDKDTKSPIGFAYLYFSGTFAGTQTDLKGNFEIDVSKNSSVPLTISAIGYYSSNLIDFSTGKSHIIYLSPKLYELQEVTVNAKSLARKRRANLTLFKDEFLGTSSNARECEILNENDITFNYDSDEDTLKAFASKPILIDNRALGYKITYYLDKFEYIKKSKFFFFKGNIIFNEDLSTEETHKQIFERKRRYAYLGSRMHFFRVIWYNDLKSTGFTIKDMSGKNLTCKEIVTQDAENKKFMKYHEDLGISYYSNVSSSKLLFLKDKVYFGSDGYFDPSAVAWEGQMAELRIGDWLPYEYSVGEK